MSLWKYLFEPTDTSVESYQTEVYELDSISTSSLKPVFSTTTKTTLALREEVWILIVVIAGVVLVVLIFLAILLKKKLCCCCKQHGQPLVQDVSVANTAARPGSSDTIISMTQVSKNVSNRKNQCKFK